MSSPFQQQFSAKSPVKHIKNYEHVHTGEDTGKIKRYPKADKEMVVDIYTGDTLVSPGKTFDPNKTRDGYIEGGDYPAKKLGNKLYEILDDLKLENKKGTR